MKQKDFKPCAFCGQGMMHDGNINFYRVSVSQHLIDVAAVRRQAGLEMLIGNPVIAHVMGTDSDMSIEMSGKKDLLICAPCAYKPQVIPMLLEKENDNA